MTALDSFGALVAKRTTKDTSTVITGLTNGSPTPNAAMYSWLLKAQESWLVDTRDALKAASTDGSVSLRVTVSGQQTPADTPSDPETCEETVLYAFPGGGSPVLRSRMNAGQYEQQLLKDDRALGDVTYGTVDNDSGTAQPLRGVSVDRPSDTTKPGHPYRGGRASRISAR
ncbi:hypothetical protein ACF09J_26195 [Streptomyces sp. NPDC014889]|uniref:hypothetical protein n=1 Tax=Streptomyces sp. NPDC014889 TaxID=3364928 RepID=UPI0036FAFB7A